MHSHAEVDQSLLENDWDRALKTCASLSESTGLKLEYALWSARINRCAQNSSAQYEAVKEMINLIAERPNVDGAILLNVIVELEWADRSADAMALLEAFPVVQRDSEMCAVAAQRLMATTSRMRPAAANASHSVMALGQQCMTHELLIRWGLGQCLVAGPFVAGVFASDGAAIAIEDRFQKLLDPQDYKIVQSPAGVDTVTIPSYRTVLNHEAGPFWLTDVNKVPQLYRARAETFWNTLRSKKSLLVFTQTAAADVGRLRRAIERFATESRYHLLVVDCSSTGAFDYAGSERNTTFVRAPIPRDNYVWWHETDYNSLEGLAFEQRIVEAVAEVLATF